MSQSMRYLTTQDACESAGDPTGYQKLSYTATTDAAAYGSVARTLQLPITMLHLAKKRNDLAIEQSCITFQGRLCILTSMGKECLQNFHQGHPAC